jgi:D-alanine-D-alanine ligase
MNKKIRVGLLFGGRSGEHEVSIASALSVLNALDRSRYDVTLIAIDKDGRWLLPDPIPLLAQAHDPMHVKIADTQKPVGLIPYQSVKQMVMVEGGDAKVPHVDVMLPILHGTFGEDGTIQGLLEMAAIPYVGSGVLGSAIGMDKEVSRMLLKSAGIQTVPTFVLRKFKYQRDAKACEQHIVKEFTLPFFVKPANAGSSVGVHKVKSREQLGPALADAFAFDLKVLIEKGVAARELEVSVLGNDEVRTSVVGEIIPHHEFYSYEAKYMDENGSSFKIPAENLPGAISDKIRSWAELAFRTLQCRGMARVDFFLDRNTGELYLNEINTIPGFTKISMYPKMWEASGLPYSNLLDELIRLAMENFEQRKNLKTTYEKK